MNSFITPNKINIGENILENSKNDLKNMGKNALIVTDKMMVELGNVKKVTDVLKSLKIKYHIYNGVNSEPTDTMVHKGLKMYRDNKCDFLIGIGGGSPLDTMKAIGCLVTHGKTINDYYGVEFKKELPNMVAIPTTAGTGSEATKFTIITNTKKDIKMLLKGDHLIPNLVLLDPIFTMSSPKSVTANTGLDALCHSMEAYTSRKAQTLSDSFAVSAVTRIFKNLKKAYTNGKDKKAREEMAIAALEAGISFSNSSVTLIHGMSRPIGAMFHVPHGLSNAMLLPSCLKFILDGNYPRFATLGRAIGVATARDTDEVAAKAFYKAVKKLCQDLHIPTLKEYGIKKDEFYKVIDKMSIDAMASGSPANTKKDVTLEDVKKIYKSLI